jgi:hypothetical protein
MLSLLIASYIVYILVVSLRLLSKCCQKSDSEEGHYEEAI